MSKTNTKLSTIEIAGKQRHLYLLGKVRENKTLSKAELAELKRYERRAAGKKIAKVGMTAKVQLKGAQPPSKKKKRKAAATAKHVEKKRSSGKAGKKRRDRPPLREAEVRKLALRCEDVADADASLTTRWTLQIMLKRYPRLKKAWDRGRFLRWLREVASQAPSIAQAAGRLGFSEQKFQEMLDEDIEVADIWKKEQLQLYVETRRQVFELAADDVPWAKKCIYDLMTMHPEAGLKANILEIGITTDQLAQLTKKSIQTIYNWINKSNLPRQANKTFDLGTFFSWYEEFLLKKSSGGDAAVTPLDPLKSVKAERIRLELQKSRNELLDRDEVIAGQIVWFHNILGIFERSIEELTRLCSNQPREKIAEIFESFFTRIHIESCKIPKEFHLPPAKERDLLEFLQGLKPHESTGDIT